MKKNNTYTISRKVSDGNMYLLAFIISLIFTNFAIFAFAIPLYALIGIEYPDLLANLIANDTASYAVYYNLINLGAIVPQVVCYIFFLCVVIIVFKSVFYIDAVNFNNNKEKHIGVILIASVAIFAIDRVVSIIYYLLGITGTSSNQLMIYGLLSSSAFPVALLLVVFLAPIVEEIIYRKFMIGLFHEKFKLNIWLAGLFSAILFALIHVSSSLDQLQYFFLYFASAISLVAAYIISNKNIYVSIIIHMINNLISVVLWLISTQI